MREVWHRWMEWKMPLCKWHVNLLLYCQIIIYWEEVTFYGKFSHNLTLEVKIIWKISAIQGYWWMCLNSNKQMNFQKISIKMKHFKIFYEVRTASLLNNIIQPSARYKLSVSLELKFSYGDLQEYTYICFPSALRMHFLDV